MFVMYVKEFSHIKHVRHTNIQIGAQRKFLKKLPLNVDSKELVYLFFHNTLGAFYNFKMWLDECGKK